MRIRASICSMQTPFFLILFFFFTLTSIFFFRRKKEGVQSKINKGGKIRFVNFPSTFFFFFLVWRNMEIRSLQILTQESKSLKFQREKRKI